MEYKPEYTHKQYIIENVKAILAEINDTETKLKNVAGFLEKEFDNFDWVGFYIAEQDQREELMLGPFVGEPTEHTYISFGEGVCGQAAEKRETMIVQDVSEVDNYLSCSIDVKAEIVVPIFKEGKVVAELDVDSHQKNSITPEQKEILEEICTLLSYLF